VCSSDLESGLLTGAWEIRAELDGYEGQSKVVVLREGLNREVMMELNLIPVPEAEAPAPTGPGYLKLVVIPYGDVYVDDQLMKKEARGLVTEVTAGYRSLRISHPAIIGDIVLEDLAVSSGDTLDLGGHEFLYGGLKVATSVPGDFTLLVDSQEVGGPSPLEVERVLVGRRYLSLSKMNFEVEKVWSFTADGKQELRPESSGPHAGEYEVEVIENQTRRIIFSLKQSP